MGKKRVKTRLKEYRGYRRDESGRWIRKGIYKTTAEAYADGCGKAKPMFERTR